MSNEPLTREQKKEVKSLKKQVENELKLFKKVQVPELQIAHLERILRLYKQIHSIDKPTIPDKVTINLIRTQYKAMCAIRRIKPQKDVL